MHQIYILWLTNQTIEKIFTSLRMIQWSTLIDKLLDYDHSQFLVLSDSHANEHFWELVQRYRFISNEKVRFLEKATFNDYTLINDRIKQSASISIDEDQRYRITIDDVDDDYLLKSTKETSIRLTDDQELFDKLTSLKNILTEIDDQQTRIIHIFDQQTHYQCEAFVVFFRQVFSEYNQYQQYFLPLAAAVINNDRSTTKYNELSVETYLQEIVSNIVQERTSSTTTMSLAVFKLQLMCRRRNADVHLRSSLDGNHDIVFLIYTGARLASILNSFEEKCHRGIYPSRRRFSDDLHLQEYLTNKDELEFLQWIESFENRFLKFPWKTNSTRIDFQLDKIFQEWILFSRRLSPYYCKVRVLTENQEHLLNIMYARLELIDRLVHGLRRLFELLNLTLIERM